jgi:hypothetical protein
MSKEKSAEKAGLFRQSIDEGYTPVSKSNSSISRNAAKDLPVPPRGGSGVTILKPRK